MQKNRLRCAENVMFSLLCILSTDQWGGLNPQNPSPAYALDWPYSISLYQSKQQMVLNAIRFLLSSQIENIGTILINFEQKFALVRVFNILPLKF